MLHAALKRGLVQKGNCELCGVVSPIEAHHEDYARPLDVRWLCASCHRELHRLAGAAMSEPSRCPHCQSDHVEIVDSRRNTRGTYRRRACRHCGKRYSMTGRTETFDGMQITVEVIGAEPDQAKVDALWNRLRELADHNS